MHLWQSSFNMIELSMKIASSYSQMQLQVVQVWARVVEEERPQGWQHFL
jgi:uncharacterized ferritin-like protein (DUF455 family)